MFDFVWPLVDGGPDGDHPRQLPVLPVQGSDIFSLFNISKYHGQPVDIAYTEEGNLHYLHIPEYGLELEVGVLPLWQSDERLGLGLVEHRDVGLVALGDHP